MSYGSWREIELAKEYRDRLLNGTQSFSTGVEEQLSKIASRATIFDIETGGLHPSSPIYEMGFMHGIGPKSTFTHEFVKPTVIGGKRTGEISPFTRDLIAKREAALQASGDLSGPFMDVLHNASTTQKQAGYKALSQLGNRDVWVQNLQHERSFINERIGAQHFENWGVKNRLQSFTRGSPTPGGGLYTTPLELKQTLGRASRATALGTLDTHLNAWEEVFTKGFAPELERSFNGTRVFDIMDLSKSVFAMAQNRGYMPKTGEIFTGTSVNTYANLMYGENELHTALADNVLQGQMVRDLAGAGYAMQKGEALPEHMQRFFGDLGKDLPEIKRRNTVKNIIDTYTNQQKFLLSKAQGKPDYELLKGARVRHSNRTLSLPVEVLDDNTGTYSRRKLQFFLRTKADPRMNPHEFSTDIEKVVRARAAREARSGIGVKVDYDAALAEARTRYIDAFEESVKAKVAGGATRAEALEHALSTHAPKMESLAQELSPRLVPSGAAPEVAEASMGSKFKNFLRENWKIGLVGAGALFAANLISSNDDDYNYIEGMKHAGISGASRKYNTDFGSGWRGIISFGEGALSKVMGRETGAVGFVYVKNSLEEVASVAEKACEARGVPWSDALANEIKFMHERAPDFNTVKGWEQFFAEQESKIDRYKRWSAEGEEGEWLEYAKDIEGLASEKEAFLKQVADAESKGLRPVFINSRAAKDYAKEHNLDPGQVLRGAIKHERDHQKHAGNSLSGRTGSLSEEAKEAFAKSGYSERSHQWFEEFSAHKTQYEHYPESLANDSIGQLLRSMDARGELGITPARARKIAIEQRAQAAILRKQAAEAQNRIQSNVEANVIPGMQEESPISGKKGIGAKLRKFFGFGSPWQGMSSQDIQGLRPFFEDISQEGLEQFARITSMDQGGDNGIRRSSRRSGFRIPTNIHGNSIMGMQEESPLTGRKGIGARMRKHYGFGSPWQGMRIFAEDILQEGLEQYSRHIARSHTLKDPFEGLNMGFQGSDIQDSTITDYSVEDADTVNVTLRGGREMTVRLAGIDAPEIEHENQPGRIWPNQPYGQEAKAKLEQILARQEQLRLAYNPDGSSSYGRTAGVLLGDNNTNINLQLVEAGAAASLPFGKRKDQIVNATDFNRAEQEALAAQRGMWNEEAWQISREMQMNSKRRITNTSYTDLGRLFRDFKTAAILNRMRNPDAEFSDMQAAGGKDDFNTIEGMKHGWIGASREANIKDFGSGYVIDRNKIPRTPTNLNAKSSLMSGHRAAVSQMRRNMNRYNVIGHHRG